MEIHFLISWVFFQLINVPRICWLEWERDCHHCIPFYSFEYVLRTFGHKKLWMTGIEVVCLSYVIKFFELFPSYVQKTLSDLLLKIIFNDQLKLQLRPPSVFLRGSWRLLELLQGCFQVISDIYSICLWGEPSHSGAV